jgi:tRNA(fMet)-specific endonuclease VapC
MRRYLFDSNALNAFCNRREPFFTRAKAAVSRGDRLGTCEPVIGELYAGLEFSASKDANLILLSRTLPQLSSWPYDRTAARQFARIYADLIRRGQIIQIIDIQLAAIALAIGNTTVVSTDTDLLRITGLSVENWMENAGVDV